MYRKLFLFYLLSCSISLFGQEKPNILLIVSEDNGPELGCYGTPIQTPTLDKLARKGVLFKNAYVPQAGRSPSRAAFLTGLYPHQNGQISLATWAYHMYNPETPNIPKSLKAAGYSTGIIGKLHINPESAFPFDFSSIENANFARKNMGRYANDAEKFMTASNGPFYLQVNYPDAHVPFLRQVEGVPKKPLSANDVNPLPQLLIDNGNLKELTANYYNCMMRLDTYIGDLISALKKSGKYKNTLVIYIGDHGSDILRGKRTSYEGGVRVPMIVTWPENGLRNTRLEQLVSTVDIYPTLLDIAGLSIPKYLPGRSLLPLLKGEETVWRKFLFTEYHVHSNYNPYPQRTVRNERYKLIFNPLSGTENPGYAFALRKKIQMSEQELLKNVDAQAIKAYQLMKCPPEYELYDLDLDPFEKKNLSHDEDHFKILRQLKEELIFWQKRTVDPLIDKIKARQLFDIIQETGTGKPRIVVPYAELMDPKLRFE